MGNRLIYVFFFSVQYSHVPEHTEHAPNRKPNETTNLFQLKVSSRLNYAQVPQKVFVRVRLKILFIAG